MNIRPMRPSELDFAAHCTAAQGWYSETRREFEGFFAHDPTGCFIAEEGGQPVGIGVATQYGEYGFIGELIVMETWRGQGIGGKLFEHAIAYLRQHGVQSILLDGVVRAVSLYERAGFRKVCRSRRFYGNPPARHHTHVHSMRSVDLKAVCELDRRAFAADRSFFLKRRLELYPELCKVLEKDGRLAGFIMGRYGTAPSGAAISAGPWIVDADVERPEDLLETLVDDAHIDSLSLGVLETNQSALAALHRMGLAERPDPPWRMALGTAADLGQSPLCWAIGSPAKG